MTITNDPQPVQSKAVEKAPPDRPWWVTVPAVLFAIFGLWALRSAVQEYGTVIWLDTFNTSLIGVLFLGSAIGMWMMKKWGAVLCLLLVVIYLLGVILSAFRGAIGLGQYVLIGIFLAIAAGLVGLWRDGDLM
jgi:hypothetical protein